MKELSSGKLVIQSSKFFVHLYELNNDNEIVGIIKAHKTNYKRANHHCYALRYTNNNQTIEIFKDDGEVGHPGKILLNVLKKYNLEKHAVVVSRIFGGKKLGIGGVTRAFRFAGESVVKNYQSKKI